MGAPVSLSTPEQACTAERQNPLIPLVLMHSVDSLPDRQKGDERSLDRFGPSGTVARVGVSVLCGFTNLAIS